MKSAANLNEASLAFGFPPIVVPLSAHHAKDNFCLRGVIIGISNMFINRALSDLILK